MKKGFTLLEVIITISILSVMMLSVVEILKSSFDLKDSLNQKSTVLHRLNMSMTRLAGDLGHAFLISARNSVRTGGTKRTIFKITKSANSDTLAMTYMNHSPRTANAKESDLSYVVYEIREGEKGELGKRGQHLYRGEFPRVPQGFKEAPPMKLIAENMESIHFEAWTGSDWSKDGWDSTSGDTENRMPQMVRVVIRAWSQEPLEVGSPSDDAKPSLDQLATVVYLPYALDFEELRDRSSSFNM